MKNYAFLLLLFCGALLLTGCSDDDDSTPSREEMLVNKRWQITGLTISSLLGTIDYYEESEPCMRDNYVEFKPGGVLLMNEGLSKCNASDAQEAEGRWSLNGNVLHLEGVGDPLSLPVDELDLDIKEMSSTEMSAEFETTFSGFNFTGTLDMTVMQ
ncbi:hypothetical protein [Rufibacter psychrotolerans]|uniref:hypothetical protein n=1 Tax=Rufibacter psychrotolerans TaxID=2812556 RepID=UPI0019688DBA|nr:hypothetical protein [Rufibacter sp. SYSU D00308]